VDPRKRGNPRSQGFISTGLSQNQANDPEDVPIRRSDRAGVASLPKGFASRNLPHPSMHRLKFCVRDSDHRMKCLGYIEPAAEPIETGPSTRHRSELDVTG
jgi:hypothetical protein